MDMYIVNKNLDKVSSFLTQEFHNRESVVTTWSKKNIARIFIYQMVLMLLVVLHSLGYFHPFFTISAHFIINVALILSVLLLRTRSIHIAFFAATFWLGASFFQASRVTVWAERMSMYAYETFLLCVFLYILETYFFSRTTKRKDIVK